MTIVNGYYVFECPACASRVWLWDYVSFYSGCVTEEELATMYLPSGGPEPDTKCGKCGHRFASATAKLLREVTGDAFKAETQALLARARTEPDD